MLFWSSQEYVHMALTFKILLREFKEENVGKCKDFNQYMYNGNFQIHEKDFNWLNENKNNK